MTTAPVTHAPNPRPVTTEHLPFAAERSVFIAAPPVAMTEQLTPVAEPIAPATERFAFVPAQRLWLLYGIQGVSLNFQTFFFMAASYFGYVGRPRPHFPLYCQPPPRAR